MSKMKFAMAMLAVGGGVGAAQAQAATTIYTDTLDISADQPLTAITLVGSTPQFDYGATSFKSSNFETNSFVNGGMPNAFIGLKTSTPGLPAPGESYNPDQTYLTDFKGTVYGASGNDTASYIHLMFDSGGTTYIGTAYIDASAELETITYEAVVPEPDAWALLIAGAALTGGALRTRRRRQSAIA
jgi:hypothetical protein